MMIECISIRTEHKKCIEPTEKKNLVVLYVVCCRAPCLIDVPLVRCDDVISCVIINIEFPLKILRTSFFFLSLVCIECFGSVLQKKWKKTILTKNGIQSFDTDEWELHYPINMILHSYDSDIIR